MFENFQFFLFLWNLLVLDKTGHLRTRFFTIFDVLQTKNYSIIWKDNQQNNQ